ncbi:actin-5-like [Ambystoma mexicanum]|uniref:actin-5-like n=1 Tax=Ambystoma mexicanum TaxID=8296 RepID=UPI0037E8B73F
MFHPNILHAPAVIVDNGSGLCKSGLAGEKAPRSVLSTIVGRPRESLVMLGGDRKQYYVGDEAQAKRGILTLKYPMEHGIVTSWDDMEKVWRYVYEQQLKVNSRERPVLLTEAPLNPLQNREKMTQVMFESFGVPAMYVAVQAMLALYAAGNTTGVVLDSGDGVTHSVPMYDGHCLPHSISRLDFAGRDITMYFQRLLMQSGYSYLSTPGREIVRDIKESLCYIAIDPNKEINKTPEEIHRVYQLPDGHCMHIGAQLFQAPEALFAPILAGVAEPGIPQMILSSVMKSDKDIHAHLFSNVVLAGGSTLFPGIDRRLLIEIQQQAPNGVFIQIYAPPDRIHSGWIGASILSSLPSFQNMWVTVSDYKEFGPAVIHRKCF